MSKRIESRAESGWRVSQMSAAASMRRSEYGPSASMASWSVGRAFTSTMITRSPRRAMMSISPAFVR
jgi:hypothetical protein